MNQPSPEWTAKNMLRRYGSASLAQEYAYGYATGAYFHQTEHGRVFWFKVWDEIERLYREEKAR